ncbi:endonuclease domain-containing protein [Xanthobacter pseudotagetidis]|uniref:endonuclease domain-containing protein n=1 Tax=Xanthobacter pseudotagetidis TaxID=3119911 RepID=UPI003726EF9B
MTEERDDPAPSWRVSRGQRVRARALRGNQTDAEQALWRALRGHRLAGLSFRRQHPIGPFVVDFACAAARLVVEVDGGQHFDARGQERDARRDAFLAHRGFEVLRFSNLDVLNNPSGVLETISAAAVSRRPPPRPSPASGTGSQDGASGQSPLPLAGEGWEGESPRKIEPADQEKDQDR